MEVSEVSRGNSTDITGGYSDHGDSDSGSDHEYPLRQSPTILGRRRPFRSFKDLRLKPSRLGIRKIRRCWESVPEAAREDGEEEADTTHSVSFRDRARQVVASLQARKAYGVYCFVCFVSSVVLTYLVLTESVREEHRNNGHTVILYYPWLKWETVVEICVGAAVVIETISAMWLHGVRSFLCDGWCLLDAVISVLTVLDWVVFLMESKALDFEVAQFYMPIISARFFLQPYRLGAAHAMVRQVEKLAQRRASKTEVMEESIGVPIAIGRVLTTDLQSEIIGQLPMWCRYREWHLAYAPYKHGVSIQIFYRHQGGPNVIIMRTSQGQIVGGFAASRWCQSSEDYVGTGESFVFAIGHNFTESEVREEEDSQLRSELLGTVESGAAESSAPESGKLEKPKKSQWLKRKKREPKLPQSYVLPKVPPSLLTFYFAVRCGSEDEQRGDESMFAFGNALIIRNDFKSASTMPCMTFGSPALIADVHSFEIADLECWQLR